tara:strand:- start:566 stop:805 length:240 start_codon:yes stop_codon:yes gene_type:complete
MSKVLDIANNQFALLSGVSVPQTIGTAYTAVAGKNSLFFGTVEFSNTVTVPTTANLMLIGTDVDFKQDINVQGTLDWRT